MPLIVAIRGHARITFENNQVQGGVCAWLIEGKAKSLRNQFLGRKKNRAEESGFGGIVGACRAESAAECSRVSFGDQGRVGPSSKSVLQSCGCCNFVGRPPCWVSRLGNQAISDDENSGMRHPTIKRRSSGENRLVKGAETSEKVACVQNIRHAEGR